MNKKLMKYTLMISCRESSKLMSESMDRELSFQESLRLKIHLFMCKACSRIMKQIVGLSKLMMEYAKNPFVTGSQFAGLSKEAKENIKRKIKKNR